LNLPDFNDAFCPLLTAGLGKPCACQKNCAWYNPTAGVCDVSVLSGLLLHEPELLELRDSLDHQCE
jgi:hypothetical protein